MEWGVDALPDLLVERESGGWKDRVDIVRWSSTAIQCREGFELRLSGRSGRKQTKASGGVPPEISWVTAFQVVREQRVGFDEHGQSVSSDETFIKVLGSFQDVLGLLKGARLSAFMCVALQESKIMLGLDLALTLSSIQAKTGYSRHTVIEALDFLVERRFLDELDERGIAGEKLYRVASYAWFGKPRFNPNAVPVLGKSSANFALVQKKCLVVEGTDQDQEREKSTTTTAVQILHQVGVYARSLPPIDRDRAERWAEFVRVAPRNKWHSPAGFCYRSLEADPESEPPMFNSQRGWWGSELDRNIRR